MRNTRRILLPGLVLLVALVLYIQERYSGDRGSDTGPGQDRQETGPGGKLGWGGRGGGISPPPSRPVASPPTTRDGRPLLLPGTREINQAGWSGQGPEIPSLADARRLAALTWNPPRQPLADLTRLPDPDGIGPCPPRPSIPVGKDSPVVQRYIDRTTLAPTWIHQDGSFTKLKLAQVETAGRKRLILNIMVGRK